MIKIKAHIKLYKEGRETPFANKYRPLFNFVSESKVSGQIELIGKEYMYPGESDNVIINFLDKEYLGEDFSIGKKFTFDEGTVPLGEGIITDILIFLI